MKNPFDLLLARQPHVCPWWCCFTFDNPLRRLIHDPAAILSPYVRADFTAIDIGPGMGYFTIEMCRLVGKNGKVIAVDVQQKMLNATLKRAQKAGVADQLKTRLTGQKSLDVAEKADFILAFWMVHEVPDQTRFLREVSRLLKPEGHFLLVEPFFHVTEKAFSKTVQWAAEAGLTAAGAPRIAFSKTMLFSGSSGPLPG
jgi:ubiquinone/menaquinone biosynthesis C-methylase UbiE